VWVDESSLAEACVAADLLEKGSGSVPGHSIMDIEDLGHSGVIAGLCWIDVSTGGFMVAECSLPEVLGALARYPPAEVLLPKGLTDWKPPSPSPVISLSERATVATTVSAATASPMSGRPSATANPGSTRATRHTS